MSSVDTGSIQSALKNYGSRAQMGRPSPSNRESTAMASEEYANAMRNRSGQGSEVMREQAMPDLYNRARTAYDQSRRQHDVANPGGGQMWLGGSPEAAARLSSPGQMWRNRQVSDQATRGGGYQTQGYPSPQSMGGSWSGGMDQMRQREAFRGQPQNFGAFMQAPQRNSWQQPQPWGGQHMQQQQFMQPMQQQRHMGGWSSPYQQAQPMMQRNMMQEAPQGQYNQRFNRGQDSGQGFRQGGHMVGRGGW